MYSVDGCVVGHYMVALGVAIQFKSRLPKELQQEYEQEIIDSIKYVGKALKDVTLFGLHCSDEKEN